MKIVLQVDYYLSFFFALDCISTATLLRGPQRAALSLRAFGVRLDLTWISEALQVGRPSKHRKELLGQGDNSDASASELRSGRTARVGARASRVVRVLRLAESLRRP